MESRFYTEYDRHERTHWWFRWRFALIRRLVINGSAGAGQRVLDAGCGTGAMVDHLADVCRPVGIDIAPEAIALAAAHGVPCIVRGSLDRMPFELSTFDTVLALDVVEHIDDDAEVLRNLYAALKPGGRLILTVPAFQFLWSDHDVINQHKRRYTTREVQSLVELAGFGIQRLTYCNAALFVPLTLRRVVLKRLRAGKRWRHQPPSPPQSDLRTYPSLINELLYRLMWMESGLLKWTNLPFGSSILVVALRSESS
jgi:SAM-dependent methyltransferase